MSWFERLLPSRIRTEGGSRRTVPEGLWTKCSRCNAVLYRAELERNADVCPKCGHHMRQSARHRLHQFLDEEPRVEIGTEVEPVDVLRFKSGKKYQDQIAKDQKATGEKDALVAMMGRVRGIAIVAVAFEYGFRAGSMGSVVGERFVRAVDAAVAEGIPLVAFACSGGARMQEGLFALFQMAKTSAALARLQEGEPLNGFLSRQALAPEAQAEIEGADYGSGFDSAMSGDRPRFEFSRVPPPALPPKAMP